MLPSKSKVHFLEGEWTVQKAQKLIEPIQCQPVASQYCRKQQFVQLKYASLTHFCSIQLSNKQWQGAVDIVFTQIWKQRLWVQIPDMVKWFSIGFLLHLPSFTSFSSPFILSVMWDGINSQEWKNQQRTTCYCKRRSL